MTLDEARNLRPGDFVFWRDPDEEICSRILRIKAVQTSGLSCFVRIVGEDDSVLEALPVELSRPRWPRLLWTRFWEGSR